MKNHLKHLAAGLLACVITFFATGCGDDNNAAADTGPESSASFEGTSITFNPTINFLAGNTMTYVNTAAGSTFPAAATATNGTYTYTPNASFTGGTLTLTIDGVSSPVVLEISGFRRSGRNVTGFTARSGGQNFPVTVTGTLVAKSTAATGSTPTLGAGETSAPDVPSTLQGTYSLVFFPGFDAPISGVPAGGTQTTFVLGARTLAFSGKTLTNPVFFNGNTEWLFKDGSLTYAVSISNSGGLNEINVQGLVGGTTFFGQYRTASPVTLSSGKVTSGTFNATAGFVTTPTGFPAASAIAVGSAGSFTFGTNTLTFDGVTFNFSTIESFPGGDTEFHIYTASVGGQTDTIRVGISTAASTKFVTFFTVERVRTAVAPTTGTVTGSFFFRVN